MELEAGAGKADSMGEYGDAKAPNRGMSIPYSLAPSLQSLLF